MNDAFSRSNTVPIGRPNENILKVAVIMEDIETSVLQGMQAGVKELAQVKALSVNQIAQRRPRQELYE
jgi:hypothetical protein